MRFSILVISYNQPRLKADATWSANAITFSAVGRNPSGIFVNINNDIFVADRGNNRILVWLNGSTNLTKIISGGLYTPNALFVRSNGDIYVDNGGSYGRVDKWTLNSNQSVPAMYVTQTCFAIFIHLSNVLYCSLRNLHQIVTKSLNSTSNTTAVVAGIGCLGSTSYMLHNPLGIFVDINFDLYVADCGNHRIQLFKLGRSNALAVVGSEATNTIVLSCPAAVILDADKYLFIVDQNNHRIIGSGPNGFRCVVGCGGAVGGRNGLYTPQSMAFDSAGNILVTDGNNNRIQKFIRLMKTLSKYGIQSTDANDENHSI